MFEEYCLTSFSQRMQYEHFSCLELFGHTSEQCPSPLDRTLFPKDLHSPDSYCVQMIEVNQSFLQHGYSHFIHKIKFHRIRDYICNVEIQGFIGSSRSSCVVCVNFTCQQFNNLHFMEMITVLVTLQTFFICAS